MIPYITLTILAIMIIIYFSALNFYNTGHDVLDYPMRAFYHANLSHLLANSISFLALIPLEQAMGSGSYLGAIVFIWLLSSLILWIIHRIFPSRKVYTVGFSGVIMGLIVLYFMLIGTNPGIALVGLTFSILPQFFVPGISFEGHLSGIIAGVIYVLLFGVGGRRLINFG